MGQLVHDRSISGGFNWLHGPMGARISRRATPALIPDKYKSFSELSVALREAGLEKSQLIVGIDFTQSNTRAGVRTFGGRSLHDISNSSSPNPYQQAFTVIAQALWDFDDDHMIPAYGFGDSTTEDKKVFSFQDNDSPCKGLTGCLAQYQQIVERVKLYGPTSFAPLIRQAIHLVRESRQYHILLIVADGQVSGPCLKPTIDAIVEASDYPLSIITVGVGDGPWNAMQKFDDDLPTRRFDNFQFVDFNTVFTKYPKEKRETAFATHALMEIPDQYRAVKRLKFLQRRRLPKFIMPPPPLNHP